MIALAGILAAAVHVVAEASPTTYTGLVIEEITFDAPDTVAIDEMRYLLDVEPGELYRPSHVHRSLELLHGLGLFQEVYVSVLPDGARVLVAAT